MKVHGCDVVIPLTHQVSNTEILHPLLESQVETRDLSDSALLAAVLPLLPVS